MNRANRLFGRDGPEGAAVALVRPHLGCGVRVCPADEGAVGDPAEVVTFIPDCGCDACDSGSQDVIDELDSYIRPVVTGEFRFLGRGRQSIMVLGDGCRQAANIRLRDGVDDILADPDGWDEWSGPSWLHGSPGRPRQ